MSRHLSHKCSLLSRALTRSFSTRPRVSTPTSSSTPTWNIRPITSHQVSPRRPVPSHIVKPNYVDTKVDPAPTLTGNHIQIHDATAIVKMRQACRIAALVRTYAGTLVKPGVTTDTIDAAVHDKIIELGAYPTPLGFYGFPKSVCTSINQVACHGIPDSRPLENGDIINIDVSVYVDGYHGDCSGMFVAGTTDAAALLLIKQTHECMNAAIARCAPGMPFSMIGTTIHDMAERWGRTVAWGITGHGIGCDLHMAPLIYHCRSDIQQALFPYAPKGHMQPGMTFTIEPILFEGSNEIYTWPDGWTIASKDQSRSAQWEETVLITEKGHEILTRHE